MFHRLLLWLKFSVRFKLNLNEYFKRNRWISKSRSINNMKNQRWNYSTDCHLFFFLNNIKLNLFMDMIGVLVISDDESWTIELSIIMVMREMHRHASSDDNKADVKWVHISVGASCSNIDRCRYIATGYVTLPCLSSPGPLFWTWLNPLLFFLSSSYNGTFCNGKSRWNLKPKFNFEFWID